MKTVEQAAKDYADRFFEERLGNCGARNGFIAGADWAERWILISEELPQTVPFLIKNSYGTIRLCDKPNSGYLKFIGAFAWKAI